MQSKEQERLSNLTQKGSSLSAQPMGQVCRRESIRSPLNRKGVLSHDLPVVIFRRKRWQGVPLHKNRLR